MLYFVQPTKIKENPKAENLISQCKIDKKKLFIFVKHSRGFKLEQLTYVQNHSQHPGANWTMQLKHKVYVKNFLVSMKRLHESTKLVSNKLFSCLDAQACSLKEGQNFLPGL